MVESTAFLSETTRIAKGTDMSTLESLIREWIASGPFDQQLGVSVEDLDPDRTAIRLPFRHELTTHGDLVHGGAIASLVDVAATAAAWSGADPDKVLRGTTVGFTVNYLSPGRGQDLIATARVVKRGKALCVCHVDVSGEDGTLVACALVTYKLD
jgi:uncharacterized protein (TIGR00369 family)